MSLVVVDGAADLGLAGYSHDGYQPIAKSRVLGSLTGEMIMIDGCRCSQYLRDHIRLYIPELVHNWGRKPATATQRWKPVGLMCLRCRAVRVDETHAVTEAYQTAG